MSRQPSYLKETLDQFITQRNNYSKALSNLCNYICINLEVGSQSLMAQSLFNCVNELVGSMEQQVKQLQSFAANPQFIPPSAILRTTATLSNGVGMAYHIGSFYQNDNAVSAFINMIAEICTCAEVLLTVFATQGVLDKEKNQGPWVTIDEQRYAITTFISLVKDSDKGCMEERLHDALHFVRTAMQTGEMAQPYSSLGLNDGVEVVAAIQLLKNSRNSIGKPVVFSKGWCGQQEESCRRAFQYSDSVATVYLASGITPEVDNTEIITLWRDILLDIFKNTQHAGIDDFAKKEIIRFQKDAHDTADLALYIFATYLSTIEDASLHIKPSEITVLTTHGNHPYILLSKQQLEVLEKARGNNPIPSLKTTVPSTTAVASPAITAAPVSVLPSIPLNIRQAAFVGCTAIYVETHSTGKFFKCVFATQVQADTALSTLKSVLSAKDNTIDSARVAAETVPGGQQVFRFFLSFLQIGFLIAGHVTMPATTPATIDDINYSLKKCSESYIGGNGNPVLLGLLFNKQEDATNALQHIQSFFAANSVDSDIKFARVVQPIVDLNRTDCWRFFLSAQQFEILNDMGELELPVFIQQNMASLGLHYTSPAKRKKESADLSGALSAASSATMFSAVSQVGSSHDAITSIKEIINKAISIDMKEGSAVVKFKANNVTQYSVEEALKQLAITPVIERRRAYFSVTLSQKDITQLTQQGINLDLTDMSSNSVMSL